MKSIKHIITNCTRLFLSACCVLLFIASAKGQVLPVGTGVKDSAICIYAHNNNIYVASRPRLSSSSKPFDTIRISRWNGFEWSYLPPFLVHNKPNGQFRMTYIYSIRVFRGVLYVAGQ